MAVPHTTEVTLLAAVAAAAARLAVTVRKATLEMAGANRRAVQEAVETLQTAAHYKVVAEETKAQGKTEPVAVVVVATTAVAAVALKTTAVMGAAVLGM